VRNLTKAAQEQYLASEEGRRATRVTLIGEIAAAWLTLASDRDQLATSERTLKTYAQTLDLTKAQFRIGTASALEMQQAETSYQSARNDIAVLQTEVAQDLNALQLLTGAPVPEALQPQGLGAQTPTLDALPGNLPSDVLLRRPDVLQAEHQLIAQNANIGAARAAFFPTISLTATIGTISSTLSNLFRVARALTPFPRRPACRCSTSGRTRPTSPMRKQSGTLRWPPTRRPSRPHSVKLRTRWPSAARSTSSSQRKPRG
jgi:multidrug efflux system outer membrane protein